MQSDITFYLKFLFASNAVKIIGEGEKKTGEYNTSRIFAEFKR